MTDKERALAAVDALKKEYPDAVCSLVYTQPLQLLIATRLAAQCTDARVNMVTPKLFDTYKTVDDFAQANVEDVQQLIKSCGLYKTKAKDIVAMCAALRDKFGGNVPDTVEQLVTLPGVGRKTANLVVGDIFNKPAVVVDTHCIRITSRLGFHSIKDATKIEKILRELLPPEEAKIFSCIISEEEIADKASETLYDIRKKIRSKENSIREKLDSLIHSSHYQQFLQEAIITQRNGRFVVPVKAECRGNVPGLVHDTSSTGATVFIEPASVVDANNDIKVLQGKERDEMTVEKLVEKFEIDNDRMLL